MCEQHALTLLWGCCAASYVLIYLGLGHWHGLSWGLRTKFSWKKIPAGDTGDHSRTECFLFCIETVEFWAGDRGDHSLGGSDLRPESLVPETKATISWIKENKNWALCGILSYWNWIMDMHARVVLECVCFFMMGSWKNQWMTQNRRVEQLIYLIIHNDASHEPSFTFQFVI